MDETLYAVQFVQTTDRMLIVLWARETAVRVEMQAALRISAFKHNVTVTQELATNEGQQYTVQLAPRDDDRCALFIVMEDVRDVAERTLAVLHGNPPPKGT